MNIFDIDVEKGFIVLAIGNKVGLIPFNRFKTNNIELVGKAKYIIESDSIINHLKLMKKPNSDDDNYILAIDDRGILHTKKITKFNEFAEGDYKRFSCCINAPDNSTWSLDCNYPFIAVGGNHRCIVIHNIEETCGDNEVIKNNLVLSGNNHNVPAVCFCENYVACNSIDGIPKIWDLYNSKLVKRISNKTTQW
jgi:hypothetical protein